MMNKWYRSILCLAGLLTLAPMLHSQAVYTAEKKTRFQVGAGILYLMPDYVDKSIKGISGWVDYDVRRWVGAEAEVHLGTIITPDDYAETSYLIGPRLMYHKKKFNLYGKIVFGRATITNQNYSLSSSYNTYAFGGGLEYRATRRFNIRAIDFEEQKWPNFEPHTLSPILITVGLSYIIF